MNQYHVIVTTIFGCFSKTYSAPSSAEAWEKAHDLFWPDYQEIMVIPEKIIH